MQNYTWGAIPPELCTPPVAIAGDEKCYGGLALGMLGGLVSRVGVPLVRSMSAGKLGEFAIEFRTTAGIFTVSSLLTFRGMFDD